VDVRSLLWLIDQLFHFHQSHVSWHPYHLDPVMFLTVLPGTDGSPRLICSLSGNCQGPLWRFDCWKEYRCSACVSHFHILPYMCLNDFFFWLEYCGEEPKVEAMPPSQAPSIHPSTSAFFWSSTHPCT